MPYSLWKNPLVTHNIIRVKKENAVLVLWKTILTSHILQQGLGNRRAPLTTLWEPVCWRTETSLGLWWTRPSLVCGDEVALQDELNPCGICPSPELKRHAFHTLSPEALRGRPLGSGKALQALVLAAHRRRPVGKSRVALATWGQVRVGKSRVQTEYLLWHHVMLLGATLTPCHAFRGARALRNWIWNGIRPRNLSIAVVTSENFVNLFLKVYNCFKIFVFFSKVKH